MELIFPGNTEIVWHITPTQKTFPGNTAFLVLAYNMNDHATMIFLSLLIFPVISHGTNVESSQQLRTDFYQNTCPDVESVVRAAVQEKIKLKFATAPALIRLFFHDCFVRGCDASLLLNGQNGKAEKDHPVSLTLGDNGFAAVVRAKQAVDDNPQCKNRVSCADILALAARDAVNLVGGPFYQVELGRRDGKFSTMDSIQSNLPGPDFNVDQLITLFSSHSLNMTDLIALSGAHTIGTSRCDAFSKRIYNFTTTHKMDPTLNPTYGNQLKKACPVNVDQKTAIEMDLTSPRKFDNAYFKNLRSGKGLFTSDQVLFTDSRTKPTVDLFASNNAEFGKAFVQAMVKLGRVGVLTGNKGEIRTDCLNPNY